MDTNESLLTTTRAALESMTRLHDSAVGDTRGLIALRGLLGAQIMHLREVLEAAEIQLTVAELQPGDEVRIAGETAVFIAEMPHPLHLPPMRLVIWRLKGARDGWSFDALTSHQVVGTYVASDPLENLAHALTAGTEN